MSQQQIENAINAKSIQFAGSGTFSIAADGTVSGVTRHFQSATVVTFYCEDEAEGGGGSGSSNITLGGDSYEYNTSGNIFSSGSVFAGGSSTFMSSGMTMTDGCVRWGSSMSVKKTGYGLALKMPPTSQIDVNGKRFLVSALLTGLAAATPLVEAPKPKQTWKIVGGDVQKIKVEGRCTVKLARFPALSKKKLEVTTYGDSTFTFGENFAVDDLIVETHNNSTCHGNGTLARTATLTAGGNSSMQNVGATGYVTANAHGNASLNANATNVGAVDKNATGNASCRITLMNDDALVAATLALSALEALPTTPPPRTAVAVTSTVPKRTSGAATGTHVSPSKKRKAEGDTDDAHHGKSSKHGGR